MNAAVTLRATTTVTPIARGLEIVSIDTGARASAEHIDAIDAHDHTRLVVQILKALGVLSLIHISEPTRPY